MNVDARWLTIIYEFEKVRPSKLGTEVGRHWSEQVTKTDGQRLSNKFKLALVFSGTMLVALFLVQILIIF